MSLIIIITHVIACLALIMIVLLQTGKGADMGAAFGGGGSQTLFGSSGASPFLGKVTTVIAIVFMLTSFSLAYISTHKHSGSIMMETKAPVEEPAAPENKADAVPQPADDSKPAATEKSPAN